MLEPEGKFILAAFMMLDVPLPLKAVEAKFFIFPHKLALPKAWLALWIVPQFL